MAYVDTSSLHTFGNGESGFSSLVWLSSETGKTLFNGPQSSTDELTSLAGMQVRKQLSERAGGVIFLADPSVPTPPDPAWRLPLKGAKYEQAATAVTEFACIRPGSLQAEIPAINGIAPAMPVLHWIHMGAQGMEWEVLPANNHLIAGKMDTHSGIDRA